MDVAEQYAVADILQKRDVFDFLTEHMEDVKWSPGDVVLDVGCGPGDITANILLPKLPNNIGHLVGGDLSEAMVQYGTANFAHPKLSFTQLDIATQRLDFLKLKSLVDSKESDGREYEGIFDKIFSFFCLQWVDQKQTLKNIFDLLNPGGDGLVLIVGDTPLYTLYEIMSKKTRWQPYTKGVSHGESPDRHTLETLEACLAKKSTAQAFADLLQEVGFEIIRCRTETRSFQFQTMKLVKEFIISINQFGVRIPNDLLEEYANDCTLEISNGNVVGFVCNDDNSIKGDDTVTITYDLMLAHFRKPRGSSPSNGN